MKFYPRNRVTFGLGTIGRDMVYSLVSMYFLYYLTDVLTLSNAVVAAITGIVMAARIFDALNDPVMGVIVDNTKSRFGRFKPWIAIGTFLAGGITLVMFSGVTLSDGGYIAFFGVIYVLWGVAYTINDISFWSMLPALSLDLKERERIGSVARICANVGLFFVVASILGLTGTFGDMLGSPRKGWFAFALMVTVIMWLGQLVTIFGVKQPEILDEKKRESTTLREMLRVILRNDQLAVTAVAMALFMIGYTTTATFGVYYFKYVYGNEAMYSIFAVILGVSQVAALAVFPLFRKKFRRETLYTAAIVSVSVGYVTFFFAPTTTMLFIGIAGMFIFVGQAFVQILMLMFLADSVDYGHWKFKKRNDSVSFSIQPFVNKMGGAVAGGVVGLVVIVSGARAVEGGEAPALTTGGLVLLKCGMLIFPMMCILTGFVIYKLKFKLDEKEHDRIVADLREWGEIRED